MLTVGFVEEHRMRFHVGSTLRALRHQAPILLFAIYVDNLVWICFPGSRELIQGWHFQYSLTVGLRLIAAMHVVGIPVDLVDLRRSPSTYRLLRHMRVYNLLAVQVVVVLSQQAMTNLPRSSS